MKSPVVELVLEVLVGLALTGVGFGILWAIRGPAAFDASANYAWGLGVIVVGGGGIGFLATREWLRKRKTR